MVDGRQFKDDVFGYFARMGAAFGHAKRVEIIDVLAQGEHNVEQLAEQISASVANTSRHLQILSAAGLVSRRVRGSARVYRLTDPGVEVGLPHAASARRGRLTHRRVLRGRRLRPAQEGGYPQWRDAGRPTSRSA